METASTIVCSQPGARNIKNFLDYEIALASHAWKLERAEENGKNGILVTMKCKKCGADRVSVFTPRELAPSAF